MTDIVTFGKYKGQNISALLADKSYVEFAKEKGFFKKGGERKYKIMMEQRTKKNYKRVHKNKIKFDERVMLERRKE